MDAIFYPLIAFGILLLIIFTLFRMGVIGLYPRIEKTHDVLVAETGWLGLLTMLGLVLRHVEVDPERDEVRITSRYAYAFAKTVVIPFSAIDSVSYRYQDHNPLTSMGGTGNSLDCYAVGLKLRRERAQELGLWHEVHLFYFLGEGGFQNTTGLPNWMYWQEFRFDYVGDQHTRSRNFAEIISGLVGASLG